MIVAALAIATAVGVALWWSATWHPQKTGQLSEEIIRVEKVDVNELRQKVKRVWTRDNYSRFVEIEFSIDVAPVRNFTLRPGYYAYETAVVPLSDGAMYSRYEFNVTQTPHGYEILDVAYINILQGQRVIKGLPIVTHWRVVNNTLYLLYSYSGEDMYVEELPIRPGSCTEFDSILPVAPSIWPYVREGAVVRTRHVTT